nr:hypothetical protein [Abalone asfa-like virus]
MTLVLFMSASIYYIIFTLTSNVTPEIYKDFVVKYAAPPDEIVPIYHVLNNKSRSLYIVLTPTRKNEITHLYLKNNTVYSILTNNDNQATLLDLTSQSIKDLIRNLPIPVPNTTNFLKTVSKIPQQNKLLYTVVGEFMRVYSKQPIISPSEVITQSETLLWSTSTPMSSPKTTLEPPIPKDKIKNLLFLDNLPAPTNG